MTGTIDILRLIAADWRRIAGYLLGGWLMFATVLAISLVDIGCRDCPGMGVEKFLGLKVLFLLLFYGMCPWAIFCLGVTHNTRLLLALPLRQSQINQSMILNGAIMFFCSAPSWVVLGIVLPSNGIDLYPWVFVFALLAMAAYQLFCMRVGVLWRAVVPAVFPFLVFPPHSHETFRGALEALTSPWPSLLLSALILVVLRSSLRAPVECRQRYAQ